MSVNDPRPNDAASVALPAAVRWVERRLRWILVFIVVLSAFVLVGDHFSLTSIVVAGISLVFLAAAYLVLRAFAAIGRSS
jgi:uncharacterized MnhB-related membrane protein